MYADSGYATRGDKMAARDTSAPTLPVAVCDPPAAGGSRRVRFYDSDAELEDTAVEFLAEGHAVGDALVVIAVPAHLRRFRRALEDRGVDVDEATRQGAWIAADASELLANVVVDGRPDRDRFRAAVGGLLDRAEGRRVRLFGEMVDLLWQRGDAPAALRLEELWNELAERIPFTLLCVYAVGAAARPGSVAEPDPERRVRVLEAELARRKVVERMLRDGLAERRRTIVALQERLRELADFFDTAVDGVLRVDPDGRVLYASHALRSLLGAGRDDLAGGRVVELLADPADADDVARHLRRHETVRGRPVRLRRRDGSVRTAVLDANAQFAGARLVCARWYLRDVAGGRTALDDLWERDRALRVAVDRCAALVVLVDPAGRIRFANAACREALGLDPEALVGRPARDVLGDSAAGALDAALAGEEAGASIVVAAPRRAFRLRAVPVRDAAGVVVLLTAPGVEGAGCVAGG